MRLREIDILNFKNIPEARLPLSSGVNCLLGRNGMGKSNLLEAVYFLCVARAMSSMPESELIRHGSDMLMVKGSFDSESGTSEEISCGIVRGKGKTLKHDGKEYGKLSEHIGRFPIVTVTPADHIIVSGGGEERRRLMDIVISQCDRAYLGHLIRYNKALESRNRMLRAGVRDNLLYDSVEHGMDGAAAHIFRIRKEWVEEIMPQFTDYYRIISGDHEKASIRYKSILEEGSLKEILNETKAKDLTLGFTSRGIHRDDLETSLGDYSMKRLGSQGQIKSFTIALRLAIFDNIREKSNETPLLLLDDIFDKLDSNRVGQIMELVSGRRGFGQIFITDTNREHLDETLAAITGSRKLIEVEEGNFKEI